MIHPSGCESMAAFKKRFGPVKITTGYARDIDEYEQEMKQFWRVWQSAIRWHTKEMERDAQKRVCQF